MDVADHTLGPRTLVADEVSEVRGLRIVHRDLGGLKCRHDLVDLIDADLITNKVGENLKHHAAGSAATAAGE